MVADPAEQKHRRGKLESRERFKAAMEHREPDRVPIDLGGMVTGISTGASAALKNHLGIDEPDAIADRVQQLAIPDDAILERLHVDSRYLYLRASRDWQDIELSDDTYQDEFGIVRKAAIRSDGHLLYYDFIGHPLSDARTVADIAAYPWPDPHDPARYAGLEGAARGIHQGSDKALGVNIIASLFEFSWYLRGYVGFFEDLLLDPTLAEAQLDAMLEYQTALIGEVLDRVGPYASFIDTGSDLGTQRAPIDRPRGLPAHHLAALSQAVGLHPLADQSQDLLPLLRQHRAHAADAHRGRSRRGAPGAAGSRGHGRPGQSEA